MRLLFICFVLSFCGVNAYAKDLIVGTISNDPPFEFLEGQHTLSGFDIDLMTEICKSLHRKCVFKTFNFHKLLGALKKGEIDLAIAAIIITPERQKDLLFSIPYKINYLQFVTLKDSGITDTSQLRHKTIGLYRGSPEDVTISQQFKGDAKIMLYDHVDQLVDALNHHQVDAIVVEYHRAVYWLSNTNQFRLLGRSFRSGEGYGIAAQLNQDALIQQINDTLRNMELDRRYLDIYQRYFSDSLH